jgi:YD repeat-containing protein
VDNNLPGQNTTTYTYDSASNLATVTYPNGLQSTFTYDPMNRLTELSMPPIADYKYTLGLTGNRTNATEQSGRALAWKLEYGLRLGRRPETRMDALTKRTFHRPSGIFKVRLYIAY